MGRSARPGGLGAGGVCDQQQHRLNHTHKIVLPVHFPAWLMHGISTGYARPKSQRRRGAAPVDTTAPEGPALVSKHGRGLQVCATDATALSHPAAWSWVCPDGIGLDLTGSPRGRLCVSTEREQHGPEAMDGRRAGLNPERSGGPGHGWPDTQHRA